MSYQRPPMPLPDDEPSLLQHIQSSKVAPPLPPRGLEGDRPPPLPVRKETTRRGVAQVPFTTATSTIDLNGILPSGPPLDVFSRVGHEVPLPPMARQDSPPVQTNKFYGNMLLGNQANAVWTHPYSLWYARDSNFFGMAVSHTTSSQRVYGSGTPPQYFFNPIGIKSFVFSSAEFEGPGDLSLKLGSPKHMSVQVYLHKNDEQYVHFPLLQGMGFVSAVYVNMQPKIQSAVGFRRFESAQILGSTQKYNVLLEDNRKWTVYVTPAPGQPLSFELQGGNTVLGSHRVSQCLIQIVADDSSAIDQAAGCYPTDCSLACSVAGGTGTYKLTYQLAGSSVSGKTLMYALPHHVSSFCKPMTSKLIESKLDSTVCGQMTGLITDVFEMTVSVPNVGFFPATTIPGKNNPPQYSADVLEAIKKAASSEVNGDVINESNLNSMYFSGKVLAKYAWVLYCCCYIINDSALVSQLLPKLKGAMGRFVGNSQILPLRYDKTWGGLISSGTPSDDFGNSYYNDHHFHYSYHVITAAILSIVDRDAGENSWLTENREWVENLLRDYANPSEYDSYFPAFRSFDWFNGHSWAKGLFESGDGKDEESSSEDVNASYAIKLWGLATHNQSLIALGDIQLGILNTSLNSYFLYSDDNKIMPPSFIPNKVSGILFENKIDHTTYFGTNLEYIQMIHAIPITPASSFVRHPTFVQEEWDQKLAPIVAQVQDGWKGVMLLNLALCNPKASYDFFNSSSFTSAYLDNGQSLTWSLAYSGAFL
ncbi:hypothetical protein HG536_0C01040 [Torulaspora globosa]|uniref:glucan endo-1,3-beta-D-glucosidase n=1 Tax=Torulaspora globosa TaxID=48254 RepID=A0A7G3ZEK1_9SACH|nr:uncharacterized protein HG536_0C01040 [Torulaspora globosa]QLL31937.1 hypothetical protein HG536_0C01040 [Torulaspora globosa]